MTETTRCPVCHRREAADGLVICGTCLRRTDDDLARIAELTHEATWQIAQKATAGQYAASSAFGRLPINLEALDAAMGYDVLPRLETWERMWREHAGLVRYGLATENTTASVDRSVGFLRANLALMAEAPGWPIDDFAADVHAFRYGDRGDPDLGIPPTIGLERFSAERDNRRAGIRIECPADHPEADGRLCGATIVVDADMPTQDVTCHRCGTVWTSQRLVLVAKFTPGGMRSWATAEELARFLEVGHATIAKWARRGLVAKMRTRDGWVYDIQQASQAHLDGVAG
jgi:hypothetical protein